MEFKSLQNRFLNILGDFDSSNKIENSGEISQTLISSEKEFKKAKIAFGF